MLNKIKFLICFLGFIFCLPALGQVQTQVLYLEASSPKIGKVSLLPVIQYVSSDLGRQDIREQVIGTLVIQSNVAEGYAIRFDSENKGRLVRTSNGEDYVNSISREDFIEYDLQLVEAQSGGLTTIFSGSTGQRFDLNSAKQLLFPNVNSVISEDKRYNILLSSPKKQNLNSGVYKDVISISFLDIN